MKAAEADLLFYPSAFPLLPRGQVETEEGGGSGNERYNREVENEVEQGTSDMRHYWTLRQITTNTPLVSETTTVDEEP